MTSQFNTHPSFQRSSPSGLRLGLMLSALTILSAAASAQTIALADPPQPSAVLAATEPTSSSGSAAPLPEDPGALLAHPADPQMAPQTATKAGPIAPKYTKYIAAGFVAQPLTAHDKAILGLRDLYSPFTFLGDVASAGYSHVLNGQPNYGTDKGAFGQRLGATVIRDASEGILTDAVFAPILHEDPRYFVEGPKYNVVHRTLYAITRPLITRTDSGKTSINGAMLIGYAGASAISYSYYPKINQNFKDTAATYGGGLAGAAVGFFVSEFTDDVLQALHLEKKR